MLDRRAFLALSATTPVAAAAEPVSCDVLVYGSTPGGIAAAVEAARQGLKVKLLCPQRHPGGMAASGLSTTDAVRPQLFDGLVAEFIAKVRTHYQRLFADQPAEYALVKDGWYYEPSVAELAFVQLLEAEYAMLEWLPAHHLTAAGVAGRRLAWTEFETPQNTTLRISARTFIDGTYEGDLAAAARVPYRVGREAKAEHGEPFAGIHYMNWRTGEQILTPDTGEASPAIQAFCARSIFTVEPAHRVAIEKPDTYAEHLPDYLPLLDDFTSGRVRSWGPGTPLPRRKHQMNGNIEALTSTNVPGASWTWPEASRHHRARLAAFHVDHVAGLIWFLQNDLRVPSAIRERLAPLGLHDEEFRDSSHWPWQIYVRQGRRIEGRARVTQHNFLVNPSTRRTPKVDQAIAIGEHSFDVHPCHDRRFAVQGFMEGVLWYPRKAFGPAQPGQVPYGAIVPKTLDNLLVPVALSCTHVAMSVLRMEPVWMTLGQVAGLAAAEARRARVDVAEIDPASLPAKLKVQIDPYAA
ncbi:MAG TPA: FAD-dependent oxidoreductase [Bryobacteraceae bacterium]|nr:FAD-dependent oxidoreductase [Bryobacteraceae bacterium]